MYSRSLPNTQSQAILAEETKLIKMCCWCLPLLKATDVTVFRHNCSCLHLAFLGIQLTALRQEEPRASEARTGSEEQCHNLARSCNFARLRDDVLHSFSDCTQPITGPSEFWAPCYSCVLPAPEKLNLKHATGKLLVSCDKPVTWCVVYRL